MYYYVSNITSEHPSFFEDTNTFFSNFPAGQRQLLKIQISFTKLMLEFKKMLVQEANEGIQRKKKKQLGSHCCVLAPFQLLPDKRKDFLQCKENLNTMVLPIIMWNI